MLQIGSRNMQNFPLLREVGRQRRPVLLKRGAAATLDELVLAAEYICAEGNTNVVLCERGVRGFDPSTRYVLDLASVPALRERCDLPVVVDPSHGTGRASLVPAMARAAAAAGADGLLIEVHPAPQSALCDGMQALLPAEFASLMVDLRRLLPMLGRRLGRPGPAGQGSQAPGTISDEFIAP
jgi:3-deoxy-7-phosphoheptulonate synthase